MKKKMQMAFKMKDEMIDEQARACEQMDTAVRTSLESWILQSEWQRNLKFRF